MKYDEYMDKECILVCDALNELPDVKTFESCCGHLTRPYMIWFKSINPYSLAIIARTFDKRYCGTNMEWTVNLETIDSESNPQYVYAIHSKSPFTNYDTMMSDVKKIVENIEHWKQDEFIDYFDNKENFVREAIKKHNTAFLRAITVFRLVNPDIQWDFIENVEFITNDSIDYKLSYTSEDGEKEFNFISLPLKYMWMDNEQIIQDYKNSNHENHRG